MSFLISDLSESSSSSVVLARGESLSGISSGGSCTPLLERTSAERTELWHRFLKRSCASKDEGSKVVQLLDSTLLHNEPNHRVIRVDCERTRATIDGFRDQETQMMMQSILATYCKNENVQYKQGMNEVLAPFVYLKLMGGLSTWKEVYSMYREFVSQFLFHMFGDNEFVYLQRCFTLFKACLRYHAPALCARLESAEVTPEMYVTPWFITLFASKTALPALLALWDYLLSEGDKFSFIFVAVSLCVSHAKVLRASSAVSLPETISKVAINSDSVGSIWKRSLKIRSNTPVNFISQLETATKTTVVDSAMDYIDSDWKDGKNADANDGSTTTSSHRYCSLSPHVQKQLGKDIYPILIAPSDMLAWFDISSSSKYIVLDCRTQWAVAQMGYLLNSLHFDLELITKGATVFPVAECLRRLAELMGVELQPNSTWPEDTHITIMGLSDHLVDTTGLLFVALTKYGNLSRISIVEEGFQAVHAAIADRLVGHDSVACPLCNRIPIDQLGIAKNEFKSAINSDDESSEFSSLDDMFLDTVSSPSASIFQDTFQRMQSIVGSESSAKSSFVWVDLPPVVVPTTLFQFIPNASQYIAKCKLEEVSGRVIKSEVDSFVLVIVGNDLVTCAVAPADVSLLKSKCDLRKYGQWKIKDLVKFTTKPSQPSTLLMYFSKAPDLVVSFSSKELVKPLVEAVKTKLQNTKKRIPVLSN